jgi:6-pyruvoyl-tetrahydropterin synthase
MRLWLRILLNHDINIANNLFNTQLAAYREAVARLDRYVLADGRQEVKEMQPTGEQIFNEDTQEMEDVLVEVVVQTAIEPVAEFVEQTSYTEDGETVTESVRNPVIVEDEVQRAEAQSVVDATPQEVIGAYHLESLETVDDSFQRHLD